MFYFFITISSLSLESLSPAPQIADRAQWWLRTMMMLMMMMMGLWWPPPLQPQRHLLHNRDGGVLSWSCWCILSYCIGSGPCHESASVHNCRSIISFNALFQAAYRLSFPSHLEFLGIITWTNHGPVSWFICQTGPKQRWIRICGRAPWRNEEAWDPLIRQQGPGNNLIISFLTLCSVYA